MKLIRETNRISLRSSIALLIAAAVILALYAVPADAAPNRYKHIEATDQCPDIKEVRVRAGWWVDSIQLVCRNGMKPRRGGHGGGLHTFRLRPGEYITGISGRRKGPAGNYVYALQIHTNLRSSPVFGEAGRDRGLKAFHLHVPRGHFVAGFETRSGRYLEKIALKTKKIPRQVSDNRIIDHHCRNIAEIRVRQTRWGSEIEVICARGRHTRHTNNRDWTTIYRPVAPSHYDGRYVSRNDGDTRYRRQ